MCKRKMRVIKSAFGLILIGYICRMLMKFFFRTSEKAVDGFAALGTDGIEESADTYETDDTGEVDKTVSECNAEKQEPVDSITVSSAKSEEKPDTGKYFVKKTDTGIKFDLKAVNGEVIATSEVYKSKVSCLNGIKSVRTNAPEAALEDQTKENFEKCKNPKFEVYLDKAGEYRFRLKAKNGQIIAVSEGYKSRKNCLNGIESVRTNAITEITVEE